MAVSPQRRGNHTSNRPATGDERDDVVPIPPLVELEGEDFVERILGAARESLGMDVAYFSEFTDELQVVRGADGAPLIQEGDAFPLEATYCSQMVATEIPNVIPDARADPHVRDLPATADSGIGSYVGVPLRTSSGELYGSLCCMSQEPDPDLAERDVRFMHVLARLLADQIEREDLKAEKDRLRAQTIGIDALLTALSARDGYTGNHSGEVVSLARKVASELGLSEREVLEVEQVALLHDIGKIAIPDSILRAPRSLTDEEWVVMRTHPEAGESIVDSLEELRHFAPAVRAGHERWDGRGYPDGLRGEAIPLPSRIVLVVDAYHAMVSDRPYRGAMSHSEALEEIRRNSGAQFCPHTAAAFLRVHE